jgi:hypothetical protein
MPFIIKKERAPRLFWIDPMQGSIAYEKIKLLSGTLIL